MIKGVLLGLGLLAPWAAAQPVDFDAVHQAALRAKAAYQTEADIRRAYPSVTRVATVAEARVQYFLEQGHDCQRVTVRGTANLANFAQDVDFDAVFNEVLGIHVHHGFNDDAAALHRDLAPFLDKAKPVQVSGHSLGAAIGSLLLMYLHVEGFELLPSINFGQPKVTNRAGAEKYQLLPLLRVVDENDPVPLVPPEVLPGLEQGGYRHFGRELILLAGENYVYLDGDRARQKSAKSFWQQVGDLSLSQHYMASYLKNIASKRRQAVAVQYREEEPAARADDDRQH